MSKLFKLKQFLTIDEAREYLSKMLEENVAMSDVYKLALDGHLTLSVNFLGFIVMSPGRIFEDSDDNDSPEMIISKGIAVGQDLDKPYYIAKATGFPMSLNEWLFFSRELMYANDIWDLSMLGQEFQHIERLYYKELNGTVLYGAFNGHIQAVVLKRRDSFCKLKNIQVPPDIPDHEISNFVDNASNDKFYDCIDLNSYPHQLVIKTEELSRFVQSLSDTPLVISQDEKPLSSKERNTFLKLIGALLRELEIEPSETGITPAIQLMTEKSGIPISQNTILKILRQVSDITS